MSFKTHSQAGKIGQWLRALALLPEGLGLNQILLLTVRNSRTRGFDALSCPLWVPGIKQCTDAHAGKIHIKTIITIK